MALNLSTWMAVHGMAFLGMWMGLTQVSRMRPKLA